MLLIDAVRVQYSRRSVISPVDTLQKCQYYRISRLISMNREYIFVAILTCIRFRPHIYYSWDHLGNGRVASTVIPDLSHTVGWYCEWHRLPIQLHSLRLAHYCSQDQTPEPVGCTDRYNCVSPHRLSVASYRRLSGSLLLHSLTPELTHTRSSIGFVTVVSRRSSSSTFSVYSIGRCSIHID